MSCSGRGIEKVAALHARRTCRDRKTGAARIVTVSEDEVAEAIRIYFTTRHNLAEGAGAAPLAALLKEKARYAGKRADLILTGGNIDTSVLAQVLRGETLAA